jgi:hypothetical protein
MALNPFQRIREKKRTFQKGEEHSFNRKINQSKKYGKWGGNFCIFLGDPKTSLELV